MRRFLVLIAFLLLLGPSLFSAATQTKQPAGKLPNPADFPPATAGCKTKDKLVAKVTGDRVGSSTTLTECKLLIHRTCTSEPMEYSSGERTVRAKVCDDFYAVARALNGREICCDEKPPGAQSSNANQDCPQSSPWFDTSTGCNDVQAPQLQIRGDTATVSVCGYPVFTHKNEYLKDALFASAYGQALRDHLAFRGSETICCDKFADGVKSGQPCDPRSDVDCDGMPNDTDHDDQFPNIDAFQRSSGASIDPFPPRFNTSDPNFRPDRTALNSTGVGPCPCQWELIGGELKCSPDGRQRHYYKATWRCPQTGAEVFTIKYAAPATPCGK